VPKGIVFPYEHRKRKTEKNIPHYQEQWGRSPEAFSERGDGGLAVRGEC
jgi:hypothetical protein